MEETMKKTKHLLLAVTSAVMALIVAFAVGCDCKKKPKDPEGDGAKVLQSIELDTSNAKLLYITPNKYSSSANENYTSDGLVIKASFRYESGKTEVADVLPSDSGVYIDKTSIKSNEKNNYIAGTYEIKVHYTYENNSYNKSYNIVVKEEAAGLAVNFKSDAVTTYTLTKGAPTVDLSEAASWIEVRKPDNFGVVDMNSAPISSGYDVKVMLGKTEVTGDALKQCGPGAYQIWASMPYDASKPDGHKVSAFVIVYINDTLTSVTFKSGTTSQTMGADVMTETWKFNAVYESGIEKELSIADVTVTGVNTRKITAAGKASVSYTSYGITVNTEVSYVINKPVGVVEYSVTYASDGTKLAAEWGENIGSDDDLSMSSSVSTFKTSAKQTEDGRQFLNYCEIKDSKTVTLVFGNDVKADSINITAYVLHNNTTDTRTARITKGGRVLSSVAITPVGGVAAPYILRLQLQNASAGIYTIDGDTSKGINLYAIEITYTVDYGA